MILSNLFLRGPLILTMLIKSINCQGLGTISGVAMKNYICDFEVFGIVQGVFFRKYTAQTAKSLNLRGWCMNTSDGTVRGQIEGEQNKILEMQQWLKTKGSPSSRIDKAVFSEIKEMSDTKFNDFSIKQ